jgi:thiol-disulfide isomerase/thioredoxin
MPSKKIKRMERLARRRKRRIILSSTIAAILVAIFLAIYLRSPFNFVTNGNTNYPRFTGFPLTLINGTTINTASLIGHPIVLWFVTTWCSSCAESQQLLAEEYYSTLHSKGIIILEVENYGDLGEAGPSLLQFAQTYGGLNKPGWLIGTAPLWVTQKFNPKEYLDIFYLVNQNGEIIGENVGLGAYLSSIVQYFEAGTTSVTSISSYVDEKIPQSFYSMLVQASKPYNAPSSYVYNVFKPLNTPSLSLGSKPIIVYIGAEYCPYCAAVRWPLVLALLRFGNFSGLEYMLSSSTDYYPNTPTSTFVNSSYTSPYIVFESFEFEDRNYQPLQSVPANYSAIWQSVAQGSIPFVDFGGKLALIGAPFSPALLSGYNWSEIVAQVEQNTTLGATIEAAANAITRAICSVDGGKPSTVCGFVSSEQAFVFLVNTIPSNTLFTLHTFQGVKTLKASEVNKQKCPNLLL